MKIIPYVLLVMLIFFSVITVIAYSQTTLSPPTASPLSQPLIREGTLAVKLVADLKLSNTDNEAEAEDLLSSVDILPKNGWIADYPVTPDIVGELEVGITAAANGGKINLTANAALQILQTDVMSYGMPVAPDTSGNYAGDTLAPSYPDESTENDYYQNEGPPTVTYYAPPEDYAYLYDWVPYPFWWSNFWFPGFFVLTDFHLRVHWHDHGHDYEGFVSNHFRDPGTGVVSRVDPANRFRSGTGPAVGGGTQAGYYGNRGTTGPVPLREYRGYGSPSSHEGPRPSVFEHSVNEQVEHAASDRGFQSRSSAGQIPVASHGGEGGPRGGGGAPSAGGAVSPRGGGSGGGFHGGGHR
ncbi:MAG: hypothetical protein ACLPN1_02675 [Dissulfurispiraceae bacterium]|jgi:hypothetical protein